MIVLDTDHMVVLKYAEGVEYTALSARMAAAPDQHFATTCISVEEQMRGWLALINRTRGVRRQVLAYEELNKLIDYFAGGKDSTSMSKPPTSSNSSAARRFASPQWI